jgi:hypothetical protein
MSEFTIKDVLHRDDGRITRNTVGIRAIKRAVAASKEQRK